MRVYGRIPAKCDRIQVINGCKLLMGAPCGVDCYCSSVEVTHPESVKKKRIPGLPRKKLGTMLGGGWLSCLG